MSNPRHVARPLISPATHTPEHKLFTIAIVGRPNVGKSTLFNRLAGRRRALVHDNPGVTRDRIYAEAKIAGRPVRLIDTGGIYEDKGLVPDEIEKQARTAMDEADLILMIADLKAGITGPDFETASMLRKRKTPWLLIANKADSERTEHLAGEFFRLGADQVIPLAAEHGRHMDDLESALLEYLPAAVEVEEGEPEADASPLSASAPTGPFRIAIVGRPNVGKSSLLNRLAGFERSIVLDLPGTTRDSVDSRITTPQGDFLLVDTAGIRRKASTKKGEEVLSVIMAQKAIEAAEICLLVIDAEAGITHQDSAVAGMIEAAQRGVGVLINKYDRIKKDPLKVSQLEDQLKSKFKFMAHAPILRLSALSGEGINEVLPLAARLAQRFRRRLTTAEVNTFLPRLLGLKSTPLVGGREYKIKYLTQPQTAPPFFVFFTNRDYPPPGDYQRFLENRLREMAGYQGVPVILKFKASTKK